MASEEDLLSEAIDLEKNYLASLAELPGLLDNLPGSKAAGQVGGLMDELRESILEKKRRLEALRRKGRKDEGGARTKLTGMPYHTLERALAQEVTVRKSLTELLDRANREIETLKAKVNRLERVLALRGAEGDKMAGWKTKKRSRSFSKRTKARRSKKSHRRVSKAKRSKSRHRRR